MELNVLLVEDDVTDLRQFERDLPAVFRAKGLDVHFDSKSTFEEGLAAIKNPHMRYDLIISDTYKGSHKDLDAAVLAMIEEYRKDHFSPIVVYSSATQPAVLKTSAFVNWADKGKPRDIDRAINETLDIGLPQIARSLHEEIDSTAGKFLWRFLEENWEKLKSGSGIQKAQLDRIVRRRVALKISDIVPGSDIFKAIPNRYGLEYYIYPPLAQNYFNLGDIVKNKNVESDVRVILTPHCHLIVDENRSEPKADFVLTIKTVSIEKSLGEEFAKAKESAAKGKTQSKTLTRWAQSPARTEQRPEGRYWYLPRFLDIPHLFCDLLQIESVAHTVLENNFNKIATLTPPYAEALQECFSSFYGSVGIPDIDPNSIKDLIG